MGSAEHSRCLKEKLVVNNEWNRRIAQLQQSSEKTAEHYLAENARLIANAKVALDAITANARPVARKANPAGAPNTADVAKQHLVALQNRQQSWEDFFQQLQKEIGQMTTPGG